MIPLQVYDLLGIEFGTAVLFIGVMGLLLYSAVAFRNPAAVILWCFSLVVFVFSGLFGIGIQLVWISILVTVVVIAIGVSVRMAQ
jgi:hypothetical protein